MSTILANIILSFLILRFLISLYNRLSKPYVPVAQYEHSPLVSILIPARNEANNIALLLRSLQGLVYQNIEIIVCDDQSDDNTVSVVNEFSAKDKRIKLIQSEALPYGWLGKNHACFLLAAQAKGQYFCFLDADVRVEPQFVESAVALMAKKSLSLLSLFPYQQTITMGEKVTVPIMFRVLLSLLPLKLVSTKYFASISAANGQCMFFTAQSYLRYQPHTLMKDVKAEDIAIAYYFKSRKEPIACLLGDGMVNCRMYKDYKEAVNGFSKNIISFFRNSLLFALLYGIFTTSWVVFLFFYNTPELFLFLLCLTICTNLLNKMSLSYKWNETLWLQFIQELAFWNILFVAVKNKIKKTGTWKGRNI